MSTSKLKITIVPPEALDNYDEEEGFNFKHPSKLYFVDGLGQYIYCHTRDINLVRQYIKENYGGMYTVRTAIISKGSGTYSCTGTSTRARPTSRQP